MCPTTGPHQPTPAPNSNRPIDVAIVGGGIAGCMLAIGLQRYPHVNAHIYESAHRFGEVGAGVVLGPNAQRATALIDQRVLDGYNRRAGVDDAPQDEDRLYPWTTIVKGKEPDVNQYVMQFKHKTRGSIIHRAHFLDELVKLLEPGRVDFGKRLDRIYETDDKEAAICMRFNDESTAFADIVIGADGVHSAVRKHVLGPDNPTASAFFSGTVQYRAVVPLESAENKLGKLNQRIDQLCGEDGSVFGVPLANRTLYYIGVTIFDTGKAWTRDVWVTDANLDDVKAHFADWDDKSRKMVELLPEDGTTIAWSVWEMPPASTYFKGRVALVGDAAHAFTPFQGAGAGQGVEDVLILERVLGRYLDPTERSPAMPTLSETVPLVLQAYDTTRRFRSQKVVTTTRENGRILTCLDPVSGNTVESLRKTLEGRQDWIWDFDQERSVKDAFQLFDEMKDARERQMRKIA